MLRDILKPTPQARAVARTLAYLDADLLLLTGLDYDRRGAGLAALDALAGGLYPHRLALRPNTGRATGVDLDGDGRLGGPRDAHGYGRFAGQDGMAVLARYPLKLRADLSALPWSELPGALNAGIWPGLRLSTTGHWDVEADTPHRPIRLLAFHATPPVFDGPEDRNGRRNHDEAALWSAYLDGALGGAPPMDRFVVLGDANLDTVDGDGRPAALVALMARLRDPEPRSAGGAEAARRQGGANAAHLGDPALDTADWRDGADDPGNLRVDYVLPSRDLQVAGSGVFWPLPGSSEAALMQAGDAPVSRHYPVWVDIRMGD